MSECPDPVTPDEIERLQAAWDVVSRDMEAAPLVDSRGNVVGTRVRSLRTGEAWDFGDHTGVGHPDWRNQ